MLPYILLLATAIVILWYAHNTLTILAGLTTRDRILKAPSKTNFFSLIIPTKNEESVLPRLLDRLEQQQFDRSMYEILIVDGMSEDSTYDLCLKYANNYPNVKCLRTISKVKAEALNFGIRHAKGDIIGVYDADTVPKLDTLDIVNRYLSQDGVDAVQGMLLPLNTRDSIASRFASIEELLYEYSTAGRARLNGFVTLNGSNMFIKKKVFDVVGLWDTSVLTEDLEMSVRISRNGFKIVYSKEILAWREVAPDFRSLLRQRIRWYRGHLEMKQWYVARSPVTFIDSVAVILSPIFMSLSLMDYSLVFFLPKFVIFLISIPLSTISLITFFEVLLISKRHLIGVPYTVISYIYMQVVIMLNLMAIITEFSGMERTWVRTPRSAISTNKIT